MLRSHRSRLWSLGVRTAPDKSAGKNSMMSSRSKIVTLLLLAIYVLVMFATNGMFTILDDAAVPSFPAWRLAACGIAVAISALPLLPAALLSLPAMPLRPAEPFQIRNLVAVAGYPIFALFGSAAIAPSYWPLSLPIALCAILLLITVWFSPGRRWLFIHLS